MSIYGREKITTLREKIKEQTFILRKLQNVNKTNQDLILKNDSLNFQQ